MSSLSPYEDGYVLLIGIRYGHWVKPLNGPLRDIAALKKHFEDPAKADYKTENIIIVSENEATTAGILAALDELAINANSNPNASVTIYYSGHGGNIADKYFLVPYDFNISEFQNTGNLDESKVILTQAFAEKINNISAKKCLVILDCCHAENIPVEKDLKGSTGFIQGFVDELDTMLENKITEKGLANQISKGNGRVIMTSCKANETSLDLGHLSLFTKVLLDSFNGTSNIENDGWVRLIDLMRYVPKTVSEEAQAKYNHQQNPVFKRIENLGAEDFIICAYDITMAKNISGTHEAILGINLKQLLDHIDTGNYAAVFAAADRLDIENKVQYNRLKREFSAGLSGVDLIDFADRLKVFLTS